jgi:hypothetical protein
MHVQCMRVCAHVCRCICEGECVSVRASAFRCMCEGE